MSNLSKAKFPHSNPSSANATKTIEVQKISQKVYEVFGIPVCKLHVQKADGKAYLSGLQPVSKEELSEQDLQMISREVSLISEQGEPFGV